MSKKIWFQFPKIAFYGAFAQFVPACGFQIKWQPFQGKHDSRWRKVQIDFLRNCQSFKIVWKYLFGHANCEFCTDFLLMIILSCWFSVDDNIGVPQTASSYQVQSDKQPAAKMSCLASVQNLPFKVNETFMFSMKIFKQRFLIVYIYIKRSKVAGWYGMMKGNLKTFPEAVVFVFKRQRSSS